jgi:hypothetical protein
MSAARAKPAARPNPVDVFTARASARAVLFAANEIDLPEAVDRLQADAVRTGLVAEIGQDEVQRLMAEAFAAVRDNFSAACGQVPAEATRPDRAAASTIEALMLGLREHGIAAVQEPKVRPRLAALSEAQVIEVGDRLQRLKPEIARAWTPDEVGALVNAWEEVRS